MTHLVLARKYRPKTFDQVMGQDSIVATLTAAIEKKRVAHAMLFCGSRGIGKTTVARIVAKALVCLNPKNQNPCNACVQCLSVDHFSSLDVTEIDGASHTGVDDIRSLRDSARYQPSSARLKIFIIDEVHMLSQSAFNALLKILEEPPPHVIFIFATTESHKIPKTVISRCQRYDFKRFGVDTIIKLLKDILTQENVSIDDAGLYLIAEQADGAMRDAESMAEQVLSAGHTHYTQDMVSEILGVVSHKTINEATRAIINGDVKPGLEAIHAEYHRGIDLTQAMDAITERFRELSLAAHVDTFTDAQAVMPGFTRESFDFAKSLDKSDSKRLFAMAIDAQNQVFMAKKPLLALELFVLRASLRPTLASATTINFCLNKLDAILQNRSVPKELPRLSADEITIKKSTPDTFSAMVEELSPHTPALASHLRHARVNVSQGLLKLSFDKSFHHDQAQAYAKNPKLLEMIAKHFGTVSLVLELEQKATLAISNVQTIAESDEQRREQEKKDILIEASSHPVVKKALEIFGGHIAQVERISTHKVS